MENAYWAVVSPEEGADLLWQDGKEAPAASRALQLTAPELLRLKVVDEIVPEPPRGAHRDWEEAAGMLQAAIAKNLAELGKHPGRELVRLRQGKYRKMGIYAEQ
jgi:acetyl-CoA carboxylase alpha subunit